MSRFNKDEYDVVRDVADRLNEFDDDLKKRILLASLVMVGSDGLLVDAKTYQGIRWATTEPGDKD